MLVTNFPTSHPMPEKKIRKTNSCPSSDTSKSLRNNTPRTAALKAREQIASTVCHIKKKSTFKHGWIDSDQDFEPPLIYSYHQDITQDEDSLVSSNNPTQPPSDAGSSSLSTSEEDENIEWDTSPEQYQLQAASLDAWSPTPFVPSVAPALIPPAFPRDHTPGRSQQHLVRRNAFRIRTRDPSTAAYVTPRTSRIPIPVSAHDVNLSAVSDVSRVLPFATDQPPPAPRRPARNRSRPDFYGISSQQPAVQEREGREKEEKKEPRNHGPLSVRWTPAHNSE